MSVKCGCGALFETKDQLIKHQDDHKHDNAPRRPSLRGNQEKPEVPPMAKEPS